MDLYYGLKAASELIKANVEPVLEQYRPVILASLSFSKFTLGTVAPQFTGLIMHCLYFVSTLSGLVLLFFSSTFPMLFSGWTFYVHIPQKFGRAIERLLLKVGIEKIKCQNLGYSKKAFEICSWILSLLSSALDTSK